MRKSSLVGILTLGLFVGPLPAVAQSDSPGPTGSEPLQEMNQTLREIAGLLRELRDGQQIDQMMKRITLQRESLAPLERRLRGLRDDRQDTSEQIRHFEAEKVFLDEAAEERPEDTDNFRAEKRQVDLEIGILEQRLARIDQEILDLESDLYGRRGEILDWEEIVDEALGLR